MTSLYSRLAATGIRKNGRAYAPYILTSALMVMIFYIISFLGNNHLLETMEGAGGNGMKDILAIGTVIMAIFSAIFLFYTNSFLIKRRKKEFGLYNILGLGKRQIARILIWETLLVYGISIVAGLGFGILFSKLAEMLAMRMLAEKLVYEFSVHIPSVIAAVIWFAIVFAVILMNSLRQLFFSRPIELLRSENVGEKPPRTNIPAAALGLILLSIAYYMAVSIKEPSAALAAFMLAVIMVILATYLLFIAGSVVMCRILQKNKAYYYQTNHFVSVSQMAYRMRRNGAGLASICILSTMVLVTISSTSSLFIGINGMVERLYPYDIITETLCWEDIDDFDTYRDTIRTSLEEQGYEGAPYNERITHRMDFGGLMARKYMGIPVPEWYEEDLEYYVDGEFYVADENEEIRELGVTLGERDILVYEPATDFVKHVGTITIGELGEFNLIPIEQELEYRADETFSKNVVTVDFFVKDASVMNEIFKYHQQFDDIINYPYVAYDFDLRDGNSELVEAEEARRTLEETLYAFRGEETINASIMVATRATLRDEYYGIYSGLFFLGIIMGGVFILSAVLIMYYKQISEGFEDAARFEILQKVGMSRDEVKSAIKSQVIIVFFLPLAAAGLHMAFAFPILSRLLKLFNMSDTGLFAIMTAASFIVFALMYVLFYKVTSKSYLNIVSGKAGR
ncbi:MAG: ABC transporter permease [Lachnospiraceae bacterium]|nr:ABC transporter permease [Ruminococcus sp.]MCM1275369.1 ABC transporter permease [Lachnospiraceae bacterium]